MVSWIARESNGPRLSAFGPQPDARNTSRRSPRADTMATDRYALTWRKSSVLGAFDEEKAPATFGRHVATSVRCLRISARLREGCKGERNADTPARETL